MSPHPDKCRISATGVFQWLRAYRLLALANEDLARTSQLPLTPGYRLKITRASRMSELVDRVITGLAALGGSAAFLEILRRWLQRRQEKRQEQLQLDVRIMEEGHALRQEAYQREREALKALSEERERRHKAELLALEAQMQAKLEALTRANEALSRDLNRACAAQPPRPAGTLLNPRAGRREPGPQRCPLSGRVAQVPPRHPGGPSPAARGRDRQRLTGTRPSAVPRPLLSPRSDESL